MSLGPQQIELIEFTNAAPYPPDSTSCDPWFQHCAIEVSDMDVACARVMQHGAVSITRGGPQTLPHSTGSVIAFKFRDPDGHPLELIHFPADTGDPCWQSVRGDGLTLGIDHGAGFGQRCHDAPLATMAGSPGAPERRS
ncbi:MAG TPA: VOC family protein [Rhodanobacteraceae bacterium]|nr:VOC family protein [Rhodanobacteraceae bacterium]